MPLRCSNEGHDVFAFDFEGDAEWEGLRKENQKRQHLSMTCCGSPVVLRTSKLGVRHFSHARKGDCTSEGETPEHLLAKRQIVEGIQRTDWAASVEQAGESGDLGRWEADVLATKGKSKVAFEVQWSRQSQQETSMRQQRYAGAGVRGLWLFRQHDFPVERDVPAFRLTLNEESGRFQVLLPSSEYDPSWIAARDRNEPRYWQSPIDLACFVEGALKRQLRFAPAIGVELPVEVEAAYVPCWKCKKETGVVLTLLFAADRVFPGYGNIEVSLDDLDELSDGAAIAAEMLPAQTLRQHRIGAVKPRYSKTVGASYLSNGCVHCDALQGRFFDHECAHEAQKVMEVRAVLKADWVPHLRDERSIKRWWFDMRAQS